VFICCFALPCTPPRIVGGRFRHLGFLFFFLSSIPAQTRLTVPVALHRIFSCRHSLASLSASLPHSLSAAGLSVTTFQLVWRFLFRSALPPPLFLLPWVAEASIQCNFSAASHSALVHLGAGRGITFGGGVVVHPASLFQLFFLSVLLLLFCCYSCSVNCFLLLYCSVSPVSFVNFCIFLFMPWLVLHVLFPSIIFCSLPSHCCLLRMLLLSLNNLFTTFYYVFVFHFSMLLVLSLFLISFIFSVVPFY
jgi:hypothetical protein